MDTLSAFIAGVTLTDHHRQRVALSKDVWRESFGHPSHRVMVTAHETRVAEFYGRNTQPGMEPGTTKDINQLVDAVTGYRAAKTYTQRKAS